ncbi:MAG: hypothetical protein PHD61_01270 [Bacteroidales bacterium]|nr:hypothetical protein [Lentimicrobiaceae bacterium]MDD5693923.1 hypothetical protein [Bacteroidales bacterium]
MKSRLFFFIAFSLMLASCGTRSGQEQQNENTGTPVLTVANFDSLAGQYIGKEIQIEGLVDHVCRHSGKRMFLVQPDGAGRVKVVTGENISVFDVALEGTDVIVRGIVDELKVDEQYLAEWEKELKDQEAAEAQETAEPESSQQEAPAEGVHAGMGEQADQGTHTEAWDQIAGYRAQIAASDKGYLSFLSVICSEYTQKSN